MRQNVSLLVEAILRQAGDRFFNVTDSSHSTQRMAAKQRLQPGAMGLATARLAVAPDDLMDIGDSVTGFEVTSRVYEDRSWLDLSVDLVRFNSVKFLRCTFENAINATVAYVNCDLMNSTFERPRFRSCEIIRTRMTGTVSDEGTFQRCLFDDLRADLSSFRFSRIVGCDFVGCNLREADFQGARLSNVRFRNCDLTGAQFSQAKFDNVDLRSSDIRGIGFTLDCLKGLIVDATQCEVFAKRLGLTVENPVFSQD